MTSGSTSLSILNTEVDSEGGPSSTSSVETFKKRNEIFKTQQQFLVSISYFFRISNNCPLNHKKKYNSVILN